MTNTQWLLDLVEEATPGPWTDQTIDERTLEVCAGEDATDKLHALAPDLARLCHEFAEAVDDLLNKSYRRAVDAPPVADRLHAALARFAELKP